MAVDFHHIYVQPSSLLSTSGGQSLVVDQSACAPRDYFRMASPRRRVHGLVNAALAREV